MKWSGNEGRTARRGRECVIIDGYNVLAKLFKSSIDALPDVESARQELLGQLKEYRAYTGHDIILVYDAYQTKQQASESFDGGIRIIYTTTQETADERIERFVYELRDSYRQITVATSDFAEQQVTFGGGALRISAREFIKQLQDMKKNIRSTVETEFETTKGKILDVVRQDVANILEKWRRG